jgi:hypothetical protein
MHKPAAFDVSQLRTGDMIFFHARSLPAEIIQWSGRTPWSHVGLVAAYTVPDAAGGRTTRLGLWEAVNRTANEPSIMDGAVRTGVRLVDLATRLARLPRGSVAVRQLALQPPLARPAFETALYAFLHAENGKSYEPSVMPLILSWLDCGGVACVHNAEDRSAYFCSELVAATLMDTGILRRTDTSAEFTPADCARLAPADLMPGARYDVVRRLAWPCPTLPSAGTANSLVTPL